MSKKRSYTMRKRAESQEETRMRIVEAAMHLHEEVGPRATTISAIAERARVQRLTVYRHFADETAIFQACTSHWLSLHPPPDLALWRDIADEQERVRAALSAFYAYYRTTEAMWTAAYRDEAVVPAMKGPMTAARDYLRSVGDDLAGTFPQGSGRALNAVLHHALAFSTWQSLDRQGLADEEKVEAVGDWVATIAGDAPHPRPDPPDHRRRRQDRRPPARSAGPARG